MSGERRGRSFLGVVGKILGIFLSLLGVVIVYYAYSTSTSIIDPKMVAPIGVFLIAIGGFMLLARVG